MKRLFFIIAIIGLALTGMSVDPPGTKVPLQLVVGAGKTKTVIDTTELKRIKDIDNKVDISAADTIDALDVRGDTITGVVLAPTPAEGTNTTQLATMQALQTAYRKTLHWITGSHVPVQYAGASSVVLTLTIPANSIGANGSFHIITRGYAVGTTSNKYVQILFNGTAVGRMQFSSAQLISNAYTVVANLNSLTSQGISNTNDGTSMDFGPYANARSSISIDTSQDITVTVTVSTTSPDTAGYQFIDIYGIN